MRRWNEAGEVEFLMNGEIEKHQIVKSSNTLF